MYLKEIISWLDEKYDVQSEIHSERFILQAVCWKNNLQDSVDYDRTIIIIDQLPLAEEAWNRAVNYIVIGTDVPSSMPRSNVISINGTVEKNTLCSKLNELISERSRTNAQLAQLNQYLLSDHFMDRLLDYFFEQFQNPIMYVDYSHYVISYRQRGRLDIDIWDNAVEYGHYDPNLIDETFEEIVDAVVRTQGAHRMKVQGYDYYIWGIKSEITLYGFFSMITTERLMTEEDMSVISTAANLSALRLGDHSYVAGKGDYSEIIIDLLSEKVKTENELAFRMRTRNWKKSTYYRVLLVDLRGKGEKYNQYIKNGLETVSKKIKHITYEDYELILLEETSFSEIEKIVNYGMKYHLSAGLSDVFQSLLEIRTYFEQGKKAINYGSQFDSKANLPFQYSDYRFFDFLNDCANTIDCSKYYHPVTADLELYDVEHKTEFFKTLLIYLECGKSIKKTCQKMYLHKNTVNYRIQRIRELFNLDYDDGEKVLYIYLSLKLHSVNRINAAGIVPL